MRRSSSASWALVCVVLASGSCGGRVVQTPGSGVASGVPSGDAAADGGASAGGTWSCAALADCCGEFLGSVAAARNAVAGSSDDAMCAAQVDAYQAQGACGGQ
jgi:hypothetical protein